MKLLMSVGDLIVRFALALSLSLGAAVGLGVLTLGLFRVYGEVRDRIGIQAEIFTLRSDYADEIPTAVIGGVVGGVAFAAMAPVVAPVIIDTQVQTGIVDEPEPELWVQKIENPANETLDSFGTTPEPEHDLYMVNITNDDNRPLSNYNINLRFRGCVETGTLGVTNRGAAVMSNESEAIQVGEFPDRPTNSTCYGAIQVDDFVPQNSALVTFVVDPTPEEERQTLYPRPSVRGTALVTDSYTWEYSGRTYANRPNLQIHRLNTSQSNSR